MAGPGSDPDGSAGDGAGTDVPGDDLGDGSENGDGHGIPGAVGVADGVATDGAGTEDTGESGPRAAATGAGAADRDRALGLLVTLLVGPGAFFLGVPFVDSPADGLFLLTVSTVLFLVSALAEFTDAPGV